MLLASCSKMNEYVYDDTGYAMNWSAAANRYQLYFAERFLNVKKGYFNCRNDGNGTGFQY